LDTDAHVVLDSNEGLHEDHRVFERMAVTAPNNS
jgi:hypothetical protein